MTQKQPDPRKRRRLFADVPIQGGLCMRLALYWLACQAVTLVAIFGLACLNSGGFEAVYGLIMPAFIAGILVLPLALLDLIVFSNKFAGPLKNFRGRFQRMADGEQVDPIQFRPGDFLFDVRDSYNKLQKRMSEEANKPAKETIKQETIRQETIREENLTPEYQNQ